MESIRYWVWLSQLNISPKARAAVMRMFETPEAAFQSKEGSFRKKRGISPQEAELLEARSITEADEVLARCEEQEIAVLPYNAPEFPERLRQIAVPPAALYVKGVLPPLDLIPVISVIGTRKASPYGVKMGARLAYEISRCGGTVVSLLSSGVDEAAARGALRSGRPCLGVLGTPHEQCRLGIAGEILRSGALISEYPPGKECSRHFFRERNRIAAGLSDGVVVVEAPEKSGTRLFVNDAVEQGKDVFAIPGNVDAENAAGTLALLKDGAKLVTCGAEVMEEYLLRYPDCVDLNPEPEDAEESAAEAAQETTEADGSRSDAGERGTAPDAGEPASAGETPEAEAAKRALRDRLSQLTEDQLKIISSIDPGSTHIDDITDRTGLSTSRVLAQLTVLEIKGFVRREAGRRFALNITVEK